MKIPTHIDAQIAAGGLPEQYRAVVTTAVLPLARALRSFVAVRKPPVWVGINGAQGTGKTTLLHFLKLFLQEHFNVLTLSLDDFYLGHSARITLAENVHPLLATRGVPGTHDLELLRRTFSSLRAGGKTALPRFDKSIDDRVPESDWEHITGRADLVLFEGWCVGCSAQLPSQVSVPINELETNEDPNGVWRTYVNNCLRGDYRQIFGQIDQLVMLKAPSFDAIYKWRTEQEQRLERETGRRYFNDEEIRRFVQHYERLTRHCLDKLPARADYLICLNEQHQVEEFLAR